MQNHPYGLFALDPITGENPTPAVVAQRVVDIRESLLFLHDDRFGGAVNVGGSHSYPSNLTRILIVPRFPIFGTR
jgi:hypothetical protein